MLKTLLARATAMRGALERLAPEKRTIALEMFPKGSCGDVCDLLGTYLSNVGLGQFEYVGARRVDPDSPDRMESHAWLRQGDVIVDITADQFAEVHTPVIVQVASEWHDSWTVDQLRPAGLVVGGSVELSSLCSAYEVLAVDADAS